MKRTLMLVFAVLLSVMTIGSTAVAQSTPEASPAASPMASPAAGTLEEGEWEYESENGILNIQITELPANAPADQVLNLFVDELKTQEIEGATFEGMGDAPEDCRLLEYSVRDTLVDASIYIMACVVDDRLVLLLGLDDELVLDVFEAIQAGETDYVPDGYEEVQD